MPADQAILAILRARSGTQTDVEMEDGRVFHVFDLAWGYDEGDDFAHVTTNISPGQDGRAIDFFFTNEIRVIRDPSTREVLYSRTERST